MPRITLLALVLLVPLVSPAGADALLLPPAYEQLVEGHTVFTVLEPRPGAASADGSSGAPATAGGVPGAASGIGGHRGVLWFNNQFLVPLTAAGEARWGAAVAVLVRDGARIPCGGAVMVVDAGSPDPRLSLVATTGTEGGARLGVDPASGGARADTLPARFDYLESYFVTDPNDVSWTIDRYAGYTRASAGTGGIGTARSYFGDVFVANLHGAPAFVPDDGVSDCGASGPLPLVRTDAPAAGYAEPGATGRCYAGDAPPCAAPPRAYNALLYMPLDALHMIHILRDHTLLGEWSDATGCEAGSAWTCPADDDAREGNSHAHRPLQAPAANGPLCPGTTSPVHGGSMFGYACDFLHETRDVDVYYANDARPAEPLRRVYAVLDTQGAGAPFLGCGPEHPC